MHLDGSQSNSQSNTSIYKTKCSPECKVRAIIVDDERFNHAPIEHYLEEQGIEHRSFVSPTKAI